MLSCEINYNKDQANWKDPQVDRNFLIIKYLKKIFLCVFTFPKLFCSLKERECFGINYLMSLNLFWNQCVMLIILPFSSVRKLRFWDSMPWTKPPKCRSEGMLSQINVGDSQLLYQSPSSHDGPSQSLKYNAHRSCRGSQLPSCSLWIHHHIPPEPWLLQEHNSTGSFLWDWRLIQQVIDWLEDSAVTCPKLPGRCAALWDSYSTCLPSSASLTGFRPTWGSVFPCYSHPSSPSSFSDVSLNICPPGVIPSQQRIWANRGLFCLRQEQVSEIPACARHCAKCFTSTSFNF